MPSIIVEKGLSSGQTFLLPERGSALIGRDAACHIRLDDPSVERQQCAISGENNQWVLVPFTSNVACAVNGRTAERHILRPNDLIQIGRTTLSFQSYVQDPAIGREVKKYRLVKRLGQGSIGMVYCAEHASSKQRFALKILLPRFVHDAAFVDRFIQQGRAAAAFHHRNVLRVFEADTVGMCHYVVMKYVPDFNLEKLLLKHTRISYKKATTIAIGVLNALSYAELKRTVHGNINPGNVFITSENRVLLSDLGMLMRGDPHDPARPWRYGAPEQHRGEAPDYRSDIYGIGATLYHAITGSLPFADWVEKESAGVEAGEEYKKLKDRCPDVPSRLDETVSKMLARDPADRHSNAKEAAQELSIIVRGPRPRPSEQWQRRHSVLRQIAVGLVPLVCLALTLAMFLYWRSEDTLPPQAPVNESKRQIAKVEAELAKDAESLLPAPSYDVKDQRTDALDSPELRPAEHDTPQKPEPTPAVAKKKKQIAKRVFQPPLPPLAFDVPDSLSYAAVDNLVQEMETLIPKGATWRYFLGKKEPSTALEWTTLSFDDSSWGEGPSGFGYGDKDDTTVFADMRNSYTTVYVRHTFEVHDVSRWKRAFLSIWVDDGCIVYLNGSEAGRVLIGEEPRRLPFDGVCPYHAVEPLSPAELSLDMTSLRPGKNVIAIHGANRSAGSSDFTLIPVLRAELCAFPERDAKRLERFLAKVNGKRQEKFEAYFEGRILQRTSEHEKAVVKFKHVLSTDKGAREPLLRLTESLCSVGDAEGAEQELSASLARGGDARGDIDLWHQWFKICAVNRGLSPSEIIKILPAAGEDSRSKSRSRSRSKQSFRTDCAWAMQQLDRCGVLRVNCGGGTHEDTKDVFWGKDCFYTGGQRREYREKIKAGRDAKLYQTERNLPMQVNNAPLYRIPLPGGQYCVTLYFAEVAYKERGRRIFGVTLEGEPVLTSYEPRDVGFRVPDQKTFEKISVDDGFLDIGFLFVKDSPKISAIQIEKR